MQRIYSILEAIGMWCLKYEGLVRGAGLLLAFIFLFQGGLSGSEWRAALLGLLLGSAAFAIIPEVIAWLLLKRKRVLPQGDWSRAAYFLFRAAHPETRNPVAATLAAARYLSLVDAHVVCVNTFRAGHEITFVVLDLDKVTIRSRSETPDNLVWVDVWKQMQVVSTSYSDEPSLVYALQVLISPDGPPSGTGRP